MHLQHGTSVSTWRTSAHISSSVQIANGVDVDQAAEAASLPEAPGTPSEGEEASISKLLGALRSHTDKHAAVQAAFKAVI